MREKKLLDDSVITESRSSQTLLITILSPYVAPPSLHLAQILKFQTGRILLIAQQNVCVSLVYTVLRI